MKKRVLSVLITLCIMLTLLPTFALAEGEAQGLTYAVTGGNLYFDPETGRITDCDETVTEAVIPEKIDSVSVTGIEEEAFRDCTSLISIVFPDSMTTIGTSAFYNCSALESVDFGNGISSLEQSAFSRYIGLTAIELPDSMIAIGSSVFYGCTNLASIDLGNGVSSIGNSAFDGTVITSITIPDSVTSIEYNAFGGCADLMEIVVSDTNTSYSSLDGVLFDKEQTHLVCYPMGKTDESYILPDGVQTIGQHSFIRHPNIVSITFPDSVTAIGDHAFYDCDTLMTVSFGEGLTTIGNYVFYHCDNLQPITLPDSVVSIGTDAFYNCSSLTSVNLGENVTNISSSAFSYCKNLQSVFFGSRISNIGDGAFYACDTLTDVYYAGSEKDWKAINIGIDNDPLLSASFHYAIPFADVSRADYFYDAVLWAVENGITNGTSETTFSPDDPCTRAQVVTFLWRAAGEPKPTADTTAFTDLETGAYYYDAVLWAVENDITNGTSETTFSPDDPCTRAQVATFLWRTAGKPASVTADNPFTDLETGAYYYDAVLWAVENGITNGTSETTFSPSDTCTRAQIVTFLYRANAK